MRSLLGCWSPAAASMLAAIGILTCPRVAASQPQLPAAASSTRAAPVAAMRAIAANRTDEARAILQNASSVEAARDRRATYRLETAQSFLFDGRYADAIAAFDAVLEGGDARGIDSLTSWAHHGMALAEALAGHASRSRPHYDAMLRINSGAPLADADSI
jgi:hypothetical protein